MLLDHWSAAYGMDRQLKVLVKVRNRDMRPPIYWQALAWKLKRVRMDRTQQNGDQLEHDYTVEIVKGKGVLHMISS